MIDYTPPHDGMKVTVLGDGAWGTALALVLKECNYDVQVWGAFPDYTKELITSRQNYRYLPGVPLPADLDFTNDLEAALKDTRLAVCAVPSHVVRDVAKTAAHAQKEPVPYVSVAKGMEPGTFKRMSVVIGEETHSDHIAALSGPSHAEEVARKKPTAVTAASQIHELAEFVQKVFSNENFRVYTNDDIRGVELSATLKNIIAIGAGAVDGCEFGDNAKSALVTRSLVEMIRFGRALDCHVETFFGLAGVGDLITTCFSPHGRNRAFGERIAQGMSVEDALNASQGVVEGYRNTRTIFQKAQQLGVEMPVTEAIYRVLYEKHDLRTAVLELMTRTHKSEGKRRNPLINWLRLRMFRSRIARMTK